MVGSVAGGPTSGFPLQFIGFSQGTCQEKDPCLVQRSVCQLTTFTRNSVSASLLTELHAAQNILTLCCASSNQTFLSVFCSYLGIVWWMLTVLVVKEINLWKTPLRLGGDHIHWGLWSSTGCRDWTLAKEESAPRCHLSSLCPYSKSLPVWQNRIGFQLKF